MVSDSLVLRLLYVSKKIYNAKLNLLFLILISFSLFGCFAPLNLTYESARTLQKGKVDIQGSYSLYFNYNYNLGAKIGYGINNLYTIKARYERLNMLEEYWDDWSESIFDISDFTALNYYEIENKFKFKNANIAIGIPIGYYDFRMSGENSGWFCSVDPRVYFTFFSYTNKFELSIIPKVHILFNDNDGMFAPGISFGMAFSSNLNKWAIRTEAGYDRIWSLGICLEMNLSNLIKINKN